ncbi:MAG: 30S ribosomal protein S3 [Clostridia bacterium]|nr:30S ribosomal protein S3 [Clostridia bacterium]
MGQKMHPHGLRVGVIKDWDSKWYADKKNYSDYLVEDHKIREYVKKKLFISGISKIVIERTTKIIKVNVYTAKPGLVIGKGGTLVETLKTDLQKMIGKDIKIDIIEVKDADINAQLVAENICAQLEKRISFRRAMKQAMSKAMKSGALGIKTAVSGRLGGADIARTEFYKEGTIPLQTLRADIDYGFYEADTTYGKIGVKVWIYKGEVLPAKKNKAEGREE